jgi:hypothetical protein
MGTGEPSSWVGRGEHPRSGRGQALAMRSGEFAVRNIVRLFGGKVSFAPAGGMCVDLSSQVICAPSPVTTPFVRPLLPAGPNPLRLPSSSFGPGSGAGPFNHGSIHLSGAYRSARFAVATFIASAITTGSASAEPAPPVVLAAGGNIIPLLEQFRTLQGENLGNKPAAKRGRREINWDGVPDDKAAPAFLPPDFFKGRGVILKTPGGGVQVSARGGNPAGTPPHFGNINPTYVQTFQPFSAERMFSPVSSNVVDLTFVVPGTDTPAVVRGFGAVYIDVDQGHTAFEYFDTNDKSLGKFPVPANNGGYSFLGVMYEQPIVAHVRIEYGTVALGPDDGPDADVAVMDDFIYDEPQPIRKKKY